MKAVSITYNKSQITHPEDKKNMIFNSLKFSVCQQALNGPNNKSNTIILSSSKFLNTVEVLLLAGY